MLRAGVPTCFQLAKEGPGSGAFFVINEIATYRTRIRIELGKPSLIRKAQLLRLMRNLE
jgi:hypothetical protein